MDPGAGAERAVEAGARPARGGHAPDFSDVTSSEDARRLVEEGRLVAALLFPRAFGGTESPGNTMYVPRPARIRVQAGLLATANAFEWVIEIW
ncbi:MAG TPA: hypothetical protein VEB43_09450 [Anaeromyxobacter sp.]|nr:hypothetical protein [Anaeromyxobacter sp.]